MTKKQVGVAIFISNRIDIKAKVIRKIAKDTSYSSKEKSNKENITILNIYALKYRVTKSRKETPLHLKSDTDHHKMIIEN